MKHRHRPFPSLPPKDRYRANIAIMLIVITNLVFVAIVGVLIQQKVQISHTISNQQHSPVTVPLNDEQGPSPTATLNLGYNASTNALAPFISGTNSP